VTLAVTLLAALAGAWLNAAGVPGMAALVLAAIVWTAGYLVVCRVWPFAACRRCGGDGKLREPLSRKAWRTCPRCKGSAKRLRSGRRFLNSSSTTARSAR
jgi:hypothetical protein